MPPVAPDARQARRGRPGRRVRLRAQVGRLPGDRLPGRRRGGDRQSQRQAHGALLPRARGGDRLHPAGRCVVDGEIVVPDGSRGRLDFEALRRQDPSGRDPRQASRRAHSGAPGRVRRARAWRPRPHARAVPRAPAPAGGGAGRGRGADPRHAGDLRPRDGPALVPGVRRRRARRRRGQAARGDVPAGQAGHVEEYDTSGPPTAWSPATGRTRRTAMQSALFFSACTTRAASSCSSAWSESRSPGAEPCSRNCSRSSPRSTATPWDWEAGEASARTPQSSLASRWSAGKDMTFVPLKPERVVEVRYDHMEGDRFRHTTQLVRWRPDRDARSCTLSNSRSPSGQAWPARRGGSRRRDAPAVRPVTARASPRSPGPASRG